MRHAKLVRNVALKSTSKFRLGAIVVRKNRVIGIGFNKMGKTHPINRTLGDIYNRGIHAEIDACMGVDPVDLKGCTVIVYRMHKDGKQALAKPCWMCMRYLLQVGVKKIIYSTGTGFEEIR